MYERYTQPARRAIFFAVWYARLAETAHIESVHLLKGLMHDDDSRANTLFQLREYFPLYNGRPSKFATSKDVPERETLLTNEVKRIVRNAAWETDLMGDYWIDTEHLLVGILKEPASVAAQYLAKTGLTLKDARRRVMDSKPSRPDYGPVPPSWMQRSPVENFIYKWRMRRYRKEIA
jgi:ATP-dependent Clp protease ATP-binding subunit ClpA